MELAEGKRQLAAALRWAARMGLNEGICNHFSLAMGDGKFLVNPFGMHWSEICASDILVVDSEANILEGDGEVERTAFCIHEPIHRLCPQAKCVLHTHMPYATTLTCLEDGRILPIHQTSVRYLERTAYDDDYEGLAHDTAEGERMASKLGNKSVMFLANHGVITTGPTVGTAFDDLYYLERAAQQQVLALSTGRPLRLIDNATIERTAQQYSEGLDAFSEKHFAALMRILDREEPEYAN